MIAILQHRRGTLVLKYVIKAQTQLPLTRASHPNPKDDSLKNTSQYIQKYEILATP